ncbi:SGNH/GDSL hydrolase family protein [Dyella sp.]|jgi:lysophospholipase L1-like esterase|uniref:SGNH/GDSL hydrolase family protein n=1 Tax=Dyella sp. TaxID=1869338 RepID=UPI002D787EBB|nr:SGNH/GDSL hydrolase family protein [Dyella sp.]HET6431884.1 SGNH/GDSL hydrolase family protein [Dyella sp.]
MTQAVAGSGARLRYLALGDSYTIGEGVLPDERWPMQLARQLRDAGVAVAEPQIIATTGWTTDELAAAIAAAAPAPADLVTLLIGVNNQYRGRDAAEYGAHFAALLAGAISLAGNAARVVVVSIPDWGVTRFAREHGHDAAVIGAALDQFNRLAQAETEAHGAHFVDITGLSRAHPHELAADGLHPDGRQYARWTARIAPVAHAALS